MSQCLAGSAVWPSGLKCAPRKAVAGLVGEHAANGADNAEVGSGVFRAGM